MSNKVVLISCVKKKRATETIAKDLYISPLFKSMRKYAEQNSDHWFILSAKYGVLQPDEDNKAPYDLTLKSMRKVDRLAWAEQVQRDLLKMLPTGAEVVILAGIRYRENIEPFLISHGFTVKVPMRGKKFGQQLQWLNGVLRNE